MLFTDVITRIVTIVLSILSIEEFAQWLNSLFGPL